MHQGQDVLRNRPAGTRSGTARRIGIAVATLAMLASTGFVGGGTPAGALTGQAHGVAPGMPTTTVTTVVTPTTTVTTTTRPTSVTTATTTVTTSPTTVTSTTVTTVAPTTTTTTTTAPKPTTTTTTVPLAPATTVPPVAPAPPVAVAPAAPTFDKTCSRPATPGLQTYLDSLPAGSVFRSSTTACYEVPSGIVLRKAITIIGGTFYDPTTVKPTGPGYDGMKPIILLKDASHVTLSDLAVLGANTTGVYHSSMVGEAGVKLEATTDVTITGVTAKDTWGDGLELVGNHHPVTGLTVDGFTTTDAGRQGVTLAEVSGASLDHVHVVSPADSGFDFESDLPGLGSDNVSISNCTDDKGFNLIEFFSGPITITNCTGFHHVSLGSPHSNAPISFVGGHLTCKRIDPQPCIRQNGGSLRFTGVTIDRMAGIDKIKEPLWSVDSGGKLVFVASQIQSAFGSVANAASVRIVN